MTRWPALLVLALAPISAGNAQDTLPAPIVIRPEARSPDSLGPTVLPRLLVQQAIQTYNDPLTTRIDGPFTLPPGARLTGTLALYRGRLPAAASRSPAGLRSLPTACST
jgi:hypothetical protein